MMLKARVVDYLLFLILGHRFTLNKYDEHVIIHVYHRGDGQQPSGKGRKPAVLGYSRNTLD